MSSAPVDYHRGPQCDNCRSTWFYSDNGLEFCKRCDAQQQGRIQIEADEDAYGQGGKVTKVKKDATKRALVAYHGRSAFEIYLQCYQLILWKQCHILIHQKGFPTRIETVVKDLWALKLQYLQEKIGLVDDVQDNTHMFSSQGETTDAEQTDDGTSKRSKGFPKLIDTLAICYLAAVLLRLPISIGDLHRWAILEEIPFFRVIRSVPEAMRSKLPAEYVTPLDLTSPLRPNDIQNSVWSQLKFYRHGFGLEFPALNYKPLLLKHIEHLALPLELFLPTIHLATLLNRKLDFISLFPKHKFKPLPEAELLSLLVVTVKLFHPFDKLERYLTSANDLGSLTVNWDQWMTSQKSYKDTQGGDPRVSRSKNVDIRETDILALSESQLDEYLDWYEDTWVEEGRISAKPHHDLVDRLEALFPIGRPEKPSMGQFNSNSFETSAQEAISKKLKSSQGQLKPRKVIATAEAVHDGQEQLRRIGSLYKRYKQVEDLPANAKAFYEAAAEIACMSLDTLVKAVYWMEVALMRKRRMDKTLGIVSSDEEDGTEVETEDEVEIALEGDVEGEEDEDEANISGDEMLGDMRDSISEEDGDE